MHYTVHRYHRRSQLTAHALSAPARRPEELERALGSLLWAALIGVVFTIGQLS